MKTLSVDIETYSPEPLPKTGVHKYAEHPGFELLLFGYSIDGAPRIVVDLVSCEEIPTEVIDALFAPEVTKRAFNAPFEIACLSSHFGRQLPASQWRCTSVLALTLGLPGNLFDVSRVVGLPPELRKSAAGRSLITYFCMPCKPTKKNGGRTRNFPHHDPAKWELFKEYCGQDVIAEMAVCNKLLRWEQSAEEHALWVLDQTINNRGMRIDRELVAAAIDIDATIKARHTAEFAALTGISKATQVAKLKTWLSNEHDIDVKSLDKESVKTLLRLTDDASVERALQLRQELSKSSVAKYKAMTSSVGADGRVRGLLQFYGANRTGRWAGRIVQMQNLPKSDLSHDDLALARKLVKTRDTDLLQLLYEDVPGLLSQLIRSAFIPATAHVFVVVDFAAIEARVLAWAAGETWRMEVFKTHGRIYEASAAEMFKVPIETIGKHSPLRQKGKVAELACIAEGERVLTDRGLVPIQEMTSEMLVWDGVEFVRHQGLLCRGTKEVITHDGLTATPDHVVWTEAGTMLFGVASSRGENLIQSGAGWRPVRVGGGNQPREPLHTGMVRQVCEDSVYRMWVCAVAGFREHIQRKVKRLSSMFSAETGPLVVGPANNSDETALRKPDRQGIQKLWRKGYQVLVSLSACCRQVGYGTPGPGTRAGTGPDRQRRGLHPGKPSVLEQIRADAQPTLLEADTGRRSLGTGVFSSGLFHHLPSIPRWVDQGGCDNPGTKGCPGKEEELARNSKKTRRARVFDLLNCGPRNRFTVSGKLVHNCGYHGGVGALIAMGALKMGLAEKDLPGIINAWRAANPNIMKFGYGMDRHAKRCLRTRISCGVPGRYQFRYESGMLFMQLPSGRSLCYVKPRIEQTGAFENITYDGADQTTKQWGRLETYAGKLLENYTQATARDCLAVALPELEAAGLPIVGHVHDEAIVEADLRHWPDPSTALHKAEEIFGRKIPWAPGLPLGGDGFLSEFYRKDAG